MAARRKTEALQATAAALRQAESAGDRSQVHRFIAAAHLVPPEVLFLLRPPQPFRPRFAPHIPGLPPDPETQTDLLPKTESGNPIRTSEIPSTGLTD